MSTSEATQLRLPAYFSDHMMVQRDQPIRIHGWAAPGEKVTVELGGAKTSVRARTDGSWSAKLPALPAGGPFTLRVQGAVESVIIQDVLVGDLWFCSGQSNMAFQLNRSSTATAALKKADLPQIRHFQTERIAADTPADDVIGAWAVCHPETAGEFTAVGFYFAREIHRRTRVPIGLIHSSWGGTPIEAWLPPAAYRAEPCLRPLLRMEKSLQRPDRLLKKLFRAWELEHVSQDPGNTGEARGWALPEFDDSAWGTLRVPGYWEGQGLAIDGAVWFRHQVRLPTAWRGRELQLDLGPIDDFDQTYVNGVKVGGIGKEVENPHRVPRSYRVPPELATVGKMTLAVRIFDQFGSGGFMGQKDMLRLSCPSRPDDHPIPLAGRWRYLVEWSIDRPSPVPQPPALPEPRAQLSPLYNGMVHAFRHFPIRGFLWYQGESNASRAAHYRQSFPALIRGWRAVWQKPELPFYFVQLANFKSRPAQPGDDCWAEVRESQAMALTLENTGMAVTIDVGEMADIHPRNKRAVGQRLALLALNRDYGKQVEDTGPTLAEVNFAKGSAILTFSHAADGLRTSDGEAPRGFALAGADRKWAWAHAQILEDNRLEVAAPGIADPVAVRYGWAVNPECNLANGRGLPAGPFRTDDWPLTTEGQLWPT